jgi:hypothetical protein
MASILKVNTIQDATNSTTAMTIDSSGRVTQPVLPCWSVEGISGTLSANAIFNWSNNNNGSDVFSFVQGGVTWSGGSDYKITVPISGKYLVNVSTNMRSTNSSHSIYFNLYKNGTSIASTYTVKEDGASHQFDNYSLSYIITLAASDYLQVKAGDQNIQFPNNANLGGFFNGHLLG